MSQADSPEAGFRILVSRDGLRADLLIHPGADLAELTPERCVELLYELGASVDNAAVDIVRELIARHETGTETRGTVLEGFPPRHGEHGYIEWCVGDEATTAADDEPAGDSDSADDEGIDHYAQSVFIMVKPGDKLGIVHPPTEGRNGKDIAGKVIRAKDGKALRVRFEDNIRQHPDGSFYAEIGGMLTRARNTIAVRNVLEIDGHVDFNTGHIDFDGDIAIRGGVKDKFKVQASGSVEVRRLVEAAEIEAGGNVMCEGGMSGRGQGRIRTGGDLIARYLAGVSVEVGGNLVIQREANDTVSLIRGVIDSPGGAIIGGKTICVGQVDIGVLGSPGETATIIELGRVPGLDEKRDKLEENIAALEASSERLNQELQTLQMPGRVLSPAEKERLTELSFEGQSAADKLNQCRLALEKVKQKISALRTIKVHVQKQLHPGVRVRIDENEFRIMRGVKGPMILSVDSTGLPVYQSSSGVKSPLASIAEVGEIRDEPKETERKAA